VPCRRRTSADSLCSVALLAGVNRSQSALHYVATAGFRYRAMTDLRRTSRVVRYLARLPSLVCVRRGPEVDLLRSDVLECSLRCVLPSLSS
jgi:hypothetical protein